MNGNTLNRYAHVTFCEDIRFEVGGKTSLIGVLNGNLIVESLPAVMPKLCLVLSVYSPFDDQIDCFKASCYLGDQEVAEREVTTEMLNKARLPLGDALSKNASLPAPRWQSVTTRFQLVPFPIEQEGAFRVVVTTEREEINPPGLRITSLSK